MSNPYTVEEVKLTPYFDMEQFLNMTQETRLGGAVLERLCKLWEAWMPELRASIIDTGKIKYLLVSLSEKVEEAVDASWERSPTDGYQDNVLAQLLCMSAVQEVLPDVVEAGCAPAPRPTESLRQALEELGVPYRDCEPTLLRRYAVVTHYPFKGACEICHLQSECPKGQGRSEETSFVLPGFEQNKQ